jgi:hypothetical protein
MVNIIRGTSKKPVSSRRLAEYFETRNDIEGILYIGYPIIGTPQGGYQIDALLVSEQHGLIIFHLVEGVDKDINIEDIQDESFTKLKSKLLPYKQLIERRKLVIQMYVATYAPAWNNYPEGISREDYPILINKGDLNNFIAECSWDKMNILQR